MQENIKKIVAHQLNDKDMHSEDIPAIDLYMDQIITLIDEKYGDNKTNPKDKPLTKTMINNYSKEGLIKPIKGKKYSKEHIMQMLLVYSMKNTLTISEIKTAINHVYTDEEFDLEKAWETSLVKKDIQRSELESFLDKFIDDENNMADKMANLIAVTSLANYCQKIAQNIVKECFEEEKN